MIIPIQLNRKHESISSVSVFLFKSDFSLIGLPDGRSDIISDVDELLFILEALIDGEDTVVIGWFNPKLFED